ncbi:MAG: GNAT family N-acetyltransferase [Chloroflexota bacterium]
MSELRPATPARRPETSRPRTSDEHVHDDEIHIDPPTAEELEAMELHLASLPVHSGASATWEKVIGALIVTQAGAGPAGNYAALPRWRAQSWHQSLNQVTQLVRRTGSWPSVLVADALDKPAALGDALRRIGWHAVQRETVLWVGRASVIAHLDPRMRIEAVQPRSVDTHEAVEREIFGLPEEQADARRTALAMALGSGQLRAYVVRVDDEPVAVARLSQGDGVAGLYGVGVREGWRGKGYGTLITTVATRAGMATGNRLVWLSVEDGNDVARHVYEKLHFREAFTWARWLASPE